MRKLVTAIRADMVKKNVPLGTYANIVLRPQHRAGVKDSPIGLRSGEIVRIKHLLGDINRKWNWVAGQEHTKFIYCIYENGATKITSISGFYSGAMVNNKMLVIDEWDGWYKVQTLKAGTDWWTKPISEYFLHHVYALNKAGKLINPPCGDVVLPLITRLGYAWIEKWQVGCKMPNIEDE